MYISMKIIWMGYKLCKQQPIKDLLRRESLAIKNNDFFIRELDVDFPPYHVC
jgi:hypothetical protein